MLGIENGRVYVSGCCMELEDDRFVISYNGGITEFYLFFDEQNTQKLFEAIGGDALADLNRAFSGDSAVDIFNSVRSLCDEKDIAYRYDSWTLGDDLEALCRFS